MKIITRDARNRKHTYVVNECRSMRMSKDSLSLRNRHTPTRRMAKRDADEKVEELSKKAIDFLNELVDAGVKVEDIVKLVKKPTEKEEKETEGVEPDEEEIEPEIDGDFDFEEVEELGDDNSRLCGRDSKKALVGKQLKKNTNDSVNTNANKAWQDMYDKLLNN